MADGVRDIVELPDPVGEELESRTLYNGLELRKVRVPLGVVAIVYEARPNVTVDAAALAIKSGNAVVLRGSSTAERSNAVLARIVADTVEAAGLPAGSVTLIGGGDRSDLAELARQDGYVDLIIPRGGEGLKKALKDSATVPVIYAAAGNCHVYVDARRRRRRWPSASPTTRRCSDPACATRPRRCSCTPTSRRTCSPG